MKNLAVLTFHLIIYLKINLLFGQSLTGFKPLRRSYFPGEKMILKLNCNRFNNTEVLSNIYF